MDLLDNVTHWISGSIGNEFLCAELEYAEEVAENIECIFPAMCEYIKIPKHESKS